MTTIHLTMTDDLTGSKVLRSIDISNLINWNTQMVVKTEGKQREMLEEWINERGNEQHDTLLTLNSWLIS